MIVAALTVTGDVPVDARGPRSRGATCRRRDVPSGRVTARVHRAATRTVAVDFVNVPSYVIARDVPDYLEIALALGADRDRRRALSERIAAGRGALFERDEPIRALERFLVQASR